MRRTGLKLIAIACAGQLASPLAAARFETIAPSAFLIDLSTHTVLLSKNADKRIAPASMTKIMTALVVFDLIKQGKLKLEQKMTVRPETWQKWHGPEAGSTMFLSAGEQVSVANLLSGTIVLSGNDACITLAEGIAGTEAAFVALMNAKAQKMGLRNSYFATANGWPDGGATWSSPRDLAAISIEIMTRHPALYARFFGQKAFSWGPAGKTISQPNRNPLLGRIAGADGIKTGHTADAGFTLAGSALQNGRRLVMVVAGLVSYAARAEESVQIMNGGFRDWMAKIWFKPGQKVGEAKVQLGSSSTVSLVAPYAIGLSIPVGSSVKPDARIRYVGPLNPPLRKGQVVAQLIRTDPINGTRKFPLVAGEAVAKAGLFRRAWLGLLELVGLS